MSGSDATAALNDQLLAGHDVKSRHIALQSLRHQRHGGGTFFAQLEGRGLKEHFENLFGVIPESAQQHCRRQLTTPVDPHVDEILGIKLKVEPGTTVRDHARAIEQLAGGMGFPTVVIKKYTGGSMQLGDDDALGTVDDKGAVLGHQGYLPHIDVLFLDVLNGL